MYPTDTLPLYAAGHGIHLSTGPEVTRIGADQVAPLSVDIAVNTLGVGDRVGGVVDAVAVVGPGDVQVPGDRVGRHPLRGPSAELVPGLRRLAKAGVQRVVVARVPGRQPAILEVVDPDRGRPGGAAVGGPDHQGLDSTSSGV